MKKLISILLAVMLAALLTITVLASQGPSGEASGEASSEEPTAAGMTGGWSATGSPAITEEVQALLDKATETLLGVDYTPVAYLGTQLVAGTNHCILCQASTVYPGAAPYYVLVYIYEDLSGNVEILDIADLDIGSLISYGEE